MENVPDRLSMLINYENKHDIHETYEIGDQSSLEFVIPYQDYTVGHILRTELLRCGNVLFAGLKCPHPLEYKIIVRVKTDMGLMAHDERATPERCLINSILQAQDKLKRIRGAFEKAVAACAPPAQ